MRSTLLGALVVLCPLTVLAEQRPAEPQQQAREHATNARRHYQLAQFEQALAQYTAAYELAPAAGVLFNIGQCHRHLGNHEQAAFFFRAYLRDAPDAPNRAVVEELVQISEQEAARAPQEPADVGAPAEPETATAEVPPPDLTRVPEDNADQNEVLAPVAVDATLEAAPRQWYRRAWFWSIVSTVVVGISVGLAVGLSGEPDPVLPSGSLGTLDGR